MLEIRELSKDLGEFVLDNVSLTVNEGEYLVILGPTGAGKTILLETVAGIYQPDSGSIILNDRDITNFAPRERNVCMVYQDYMLFPHCTVEKNIGFGLKSRNEDADTISKKVLEGASLLHIDHLLHRYPDTLSGGEQQRTAIARAIIMEPTILLLDEPLSALDGQTREKLRRELRRLHELYSITILHVTHNFEEVFSLADRVAVMNEGQIIQVGTPEEVFRKPNSPFVASFTGVGNLFFGTCRDENDISIFSVDGHRIATARCGMEGEAYAAIRPEDILLSKEPLEASAQNSFSGTITEIVDNGMVVSVTVDAGLSFMAALTRRGFYELGLKEGDCAVLTFKATAVHLFN